ncbi:MAG TPA: D-alanyl-D-alanine carboxypeptidase [Acidimicrobiales bacterium]|nr:D-alanyl-D-alanine carboxypeptidase [Acidimicrobiales bacterium]
MGRRAIQGRVRVALSGLAVALLLAGVVGLGAIDGAASPLGLRPAGSASVPRAAPAGPVHRPTGAGTAAGGPVGGPAGGATGRLAPILAQLDATLGGRAGCVAVEVAGSPAVTSGAGSGAGAALAPASAQKLLVAAAALATLGPQHRFVTEVMASEPVVHGVAPHLWLVGSGDPMLATDAYLGLVLTHSHVPNPPVTPLDWLAQALRRAGISSVPTGISGDDSLLSQRRYLPTWKPVYLSEGDVGPLSALSLDEGWAHWLSSWVPVADPPAYAAAGLSGLLRADGVAVGPTGPDGLAPVGAHPVASVTSAPLSAIVAYMLATSDNHIAELLTRLVGAAVTGRGTTPAGTAAVLSVAAGLGVPTAGAVMVDGSGLSPENRATCPELLAAYELRHRPALAAITSGVPVAGRTGTLYDLWQGPPLGGRLAVKGGWIDGVASMVGTFDGRRPVDFALMMNGSFDYPTALSVQTRAADAIAAWADR